MSSPDKLKCQIVSSFLRYFTPNKNKNYNVYAHHLLILFYPFQTESDLKSYNSYIKKLEPQSARTTHNQSQPPKATHNHRKPITISMKIYISNFLQLMNYILSFYCSVIKYFYEWKKKSQIFLFTNLAKQQVSKITKTHVVSAFGKSKWTKLFF